MNQANWQAIGELSTSFELKSKKKNLFASDYFIMVPILQKALGIISANHVAN